VIRSPDFVVENPTGPYLRRWWIIPRNKWFNVYLHHFLQSDDDRALHDHPWTFNISILLKGHYLEHRLGGKVRRRRRFIPIIRIGKAPHRVELIENKPVWTVFITGRVVREWGFYCPSGWKHWKKFVSTFEGGNGKGPGCAEPEPAQKEPEGGGPA
jgi:hypothetical protein